MYQIIFYKDENGISEVEKYIKELRDKKENNKDSRIKYEKIDIYLNLLTKCGLRLGEPYIKHLEKDLWELRPLRDRIIFAHLEENNIILLTHFIKTTKKTPRKEIKRAYKLLKIVKEEINDERKF